MGMCEPVVVGNDTVGGGGGADTLIGGAGNDSLDGGAGDDVVAGGTGNNTMLGGTGAEVITYAASTAGVNVSLAITGNQNTVGAGTDALSGFENLTGSAFNDTLTGDALNNVLDGGAGADRMDGGRGNDTFIVNAAGDVVVEGNNGGTETVLTNLLNYTLGSAIENLTFTGPGNATGTGNASNNVLNGAGGDDSLSGLAGNDTLLGGTGNDAIRGGAGADRMTGGAGNDKFHFATGDSAVATPDVITDFAKGFDIIDLSGIDANSRTNGDQAFTAISLVNSGSVAFTGVGTLRSYQAGGFTYIEGNTDTNLTTAEFQIRLEGLITLVTSDFIL